MFAYGPCDGCGAVFGFNPDLVPSLHHEGRTLIFCRACIERANASPQRKALGLPPHVIEPGAYETGPEGGTLVDGGE